MYLLKNIFSNLTYDGRELTSESIKNFSHYKTYESQNLRRDRKYWNMGWHLTSMSSSNIQYAKMIIDHEIDQIRKEWDTWTL